MSCHGKTGDEKKGKARRNAGKKGKLSSGGEPGKKGVWKGPEKVNVALTRNWEVTPSRCRGNLEQKED